MFFGAQLVHLEDAPLGSAKAQPRFDAVYWETLRSAMPRRNNDGRSRGSEAKKEGETVSWLAPPSKRLLRRIAAVTRPPPEPKRDFDLPLRILCLESGRGAPTGPQLRQLLGFPTLVDRVVPADHCDVAVYETPSEVAYMRLRLERPATESFIQIVVKWCDLESMQLVLRHNVAEKWEPPEWWLASEELEEKCDPYQTEVSMEHKDIQVQSFALGCALGYNTFIAHFDSTLTAPPPSASKTSSEKSGKSGTAKPRPDKAASANARGAATGVKPTPSSRKRQAGTKVSKAAGVSVPAETIDQHEQAPESAASESSIEPLHAEGLDPQTPATVEDTFYGGSISPPPEVCDYQELALTGDLNSEMSAHSEHPCSEPCLSIPDLPCLEAESGFLSPAPLATSAQEEPSDETQATSIEAGMYEPLSMAAWPDLRAAEAQRAASSWRSPKPVPTQAVFTAAPFTPPRQESGLVVGSAAVASPPRFQTVPVPTRSAASIPGWAAIPRSAVMEFDEPSVPAEPQETDSRAGPVSFPSGSPSVSEVQPPDVPSTMGTDLAHDASAPLTDQLNTPSMHPQVGVETNCDLPSPPPPNQSPSTDIGEHQATATCAASQQAPSDTQPSPLPPIKIHSSRNVQYGLRVTKPYSTGHISSGCSGSSPPMPEPRCSESTSSSAPVAASEGYKVTQCNAHFEHCSHTLFLYFVDARFGGKKAGQSKLYRLVLRYSSVCRIVLCKTSPTATTMYLHLLHPPLLYKVCAGIHSNCHREGNYLPQFNLSDSTPWDRAVEFGEGPYMCGVDVLGKSRVLRMSLSGPRHWDCVSNFILRTRKSAQVFYSPMREMHAVRDLKTVPRPSVRDYGVTYALLSAWSCSFQAADELALDPTGYRETLKKLSARLKECPRAVEEALFELYTSSSQGKIFHFQTGLERLYAQYREHRVRSDAFTGSVIAQELPDHMVNVRKVVLTPTRRVYLPPQLVCKSRLLQHFDPEYAVRVVVRDDDCKLISFALGACKDDFLSAVIKPPLSYGLKIGDRRFVFLGCSTSQLRNHGVWFYSQDEQGRTAESIRSGIGDLSCIHTVPKFMARMGQAFSQSLGFVTVPRQYTTVDEDIRTNSAGGDSSRRSYIFSDGIGRISYALLRKVHKALELDEGDEPCAVQIRYGGCKGMLLLDPTLSGRQIIFRESMRKFPSDHEDLFVLKTSKPRVLYLNRPMITILEQSGIKPKAFLTLQNRMLDSFIDSMLETNEAAQVLCAYSALKLPYKELAGVGIDLTVEPFFRGLVRAVNKKALKDLKTKARILVPPTYGRTMFGVLDETGTLEYGQVFVQYSNDLLRHKNGDPSTIVRGDVIVTKNPCMHPGDIRKLTAVDVPELHHVRDCIVFPAKGDRPHPDEMAGSDLDGDEYSVLWYPDLIFKANANPMHYFSDPPRDRRESINVQDMVDFFCQYIKGDKIGLIANAHLVWADMLDSGINSRRCRDLARKCAVNLDFAKCGDLKGFQNCEKPPMYPDFMEKLDTKNTYCSKKVLGQLYRNCKRVELSTECLDVVEDSIPDERLLLEGRENYVEEARGAYRRYAMKIRALLKSYRIETESEALSGAVSKVSKFVKEKNDATDVAMVLESQVEHVVRVTRAEFFADDMDIRQENLKASAWYQVAYELQSAEGIQSFPWVVSDVLMRIVVDYATSARPLRNPRTSLSQRLAELLAAETEEAPKCEAGCGDSKVLNNLLKLMYEWIDASREFLFVKDPHELALYKNIMREACVKVTRSISAEAEPHKVVILCLRFACAWCLKIFQGGTDGELISRECRRRYRLGNLALITLNRLSMSGNLTYLHRAPEGTTTTEIVRVYIDREDEEFFTIIRRYEDVFTAIMIDWSGVTDIQCKLKKDRTDEWFLQLMVTGSRWALERLKEIIVYPSFREVLTEVFKREMAQHD